MKLMTPLRPIPELTENEKKMPLSKYYRTPVMPEPLTMQLLENGPVDPEDVIKPEDWLDLVLFEGYHKVEFGYCMFPDGTGYTAEYQRSYAGVTPEMNGWWHRWMNTLPKSTLPGEGNLKFKLWEPHDHEDHHYVNGKDGSDGTFCTDWLDLGARKHPPIGSVRHPITLDELGVPKELQEEIKARGCRLGAAWESFDIQGSHFVVTFTRPYYLGGTESFGREWIGWKPVDGKIVRDPFAPTCEEYLKDVLKHNVIEHSHINSFLPELYAEYKDKPMDAD